MERALKVQIIPAAPGFNALTFYRGENNKPKCDSVSIIAWQLLIATNFEIGVMDGKPQYGDAVIDKSPVLLGDYDDFQLFDAIEYPNGRVQEKDASHTFSNVSQWLKHIDNCRSVSED